MKQHIRVVFLAALLVLLLASTALANTDGSEPALTRQPDRLTLQLGPQWAGVEFELRTDAGVFPAPILVDQFGILTMDLGGSTQYVLSCIASSVPIPSPTPEAPHEELILPVDLTEPEETVKPEPPPAAPEPVVPEEPAPEPVSEPASPDPASEESEGNPLTPIVIILLLLVAALAVLILRGYLKNRQSCYDDWEEEAQ